MSTTAAAALGVPTDTAAQVMKDLPPPRRSAKKRRDASAKKRRRRLEEAAEEAKHKAKLEAAKAKRAPAESLANQAADRAKPRDIDIRIRSLPITLTIAASPEKEKEKK